MDEQRTAEDVSGVRQVEHRRRGLDARLRLHAGDQLPEEAGLLESSG